MNLLNDKVAVITGAARGIGEATARLFADNGARVVIGDLDLAAAEQAAKEIDPERVHGFGCDVADPGQVTALLAFAREEFGSVDVVVNNAGITRDATLKKMTVDQFDQVVAVHLRGAWLGTQAAAEAMRAQGSGGAIINMSSISGKVGFFGQTNYSAAKAGMHGFSKALAYEVARKGVTVNTISPGYIGTKMVLAIPKDVLDSKILPQIPMGRLGKPDEVAGLCAYLASDEAAFVTGANIAINGGQHMQ